MMLLSRFSINGAAAPTAAICMARRCRSGFSSLRTREIKACRALLFDRLVTSSGFAYGNPQLGGLPATWAGSLTVRGGSNISPVEVERVLLSRPLVREAVVFGIPDPVLGQRVAAVVQLSSGVGQRRAWRHSERHQGAARGLQGAGAAVGCRRRAARPARQGRSPGGGGNGDARQGGLIRVARLAASV